MEVPLQTYPKKGFPLTKGEPVFGFLRRRGGGPCKSSGAVTSPFYALFGSTVVVARIAGLITRLHDRAALFFVWTQTWRLICQEEEALSTS